MSLPLQLVVLSVPSLVYALVQRARHVSRVEICRDLGLRRCQGVDLVCALGATALVSFLAWAAFSIIPVKVLDDPRASTSAYAGVTLTAGTFLMALLREAVYVALGEEVFFRGFLGGWLNRRLGFAAGNVVQSLVFVLPHLLLLTLSLRLWPLTLVQLIAGWLMGWLRYRSDSILPSWLAHTLINTLSAASAMQ